MSTYITAVVAGEYHGVFDTYQGQFGEIPLGLYCRQSLVEHLDREELVKITSQSFAFFEEKFAMAYPFEKYDQLFVPEYNMGAMENAGCVTLRDEYLPRSRQPRSFYEFRCSVITHEMAHMWFGDLVTMKWWDDLWLNESFAEWACYWCEAEATEFTDAWTGFANARKQTGYRADQLPSTHPIAADNYDLEAVEVNFDMITYAKGASVLKQLVAWVGLEPVRGRPAPVLHRPRLRQHRVLRPARRPRAVLGPRARQLGRGVAADRGRQHARPGVRARRRRRLQPPRRAPERRTPTTRRCAATASASACTTTSTAAWSAATTSRSTSRARRTDIKEAVGQRQPDLLLLNDGDLAYAKIRLDERSLATAVDGLSRASTTPWPAPWSGAPPGT